MEENISLFEATGVMVTEYLYFSDMVFVLVLFSSDVQCNSKHRKQQ